MTEYLEKLALTCSYNQLGGILFDKRLRFLVTFLSGITQWSVSVLDFIAFEIKHLRSRILMILFIISFHLSLISDP